MILQLSLIFQHFFIYIHISICISICRSRRCSNICKEEETNKREKEWSPFFSILCFLPLSNVGSTRCCHISNHLQSIFLVLLKEKLSKLYDIYVHFYRVTYLFLFHPFLDTRVTLLFLSIGEDHQSCTLTDINCCLNVLFSYQQ
jgi:hypothetical protein